MALKLKNPIVDILTGEEEEPEWIIPDFLIQGSMICLVGESGSGKSYVSYTMGLAIASGAPIFGGMLKPKEPRRVLFFDDENSTPDRNKYLRRAYYGLSALNGKAPDLKLLEENFWVESQQLGMDGWDEVAEGHVIRVNPHLIVYDTANTCFGIEEENNNGTALRHLKKAQIVAAKGEYVATSIFLKHAKTRTERGQIRTIRGAKAWKDRTDGTVFQVRSAGRPRKDGLAKTMLVPDKVRAYGLQHAIYIDPKWTDKDKTGMSLQGSKESGAKKTRFMNPEDDEWS